MARVTRSTNPLHFEDLEPRRFEDLVRQLAYDLRPWRSIEALGRSGSDDGLDIRAQEITTTSPPEDKDEAGEEVQPGDSHTEDRQWIIQCKREKQIGPKDAKTLVGAALPLQEGTVHGFVLAAACDISKKTRDAFRDECRKHGVQEVQVWAKGELEDMLFQPKNDHLLFAHFGISLQVRRRSVKSEVRTYLALKKKLFDHFGALGTQGYVVALIRDPKEEGYPWIKSPKDFVKAPRWFRLEFDSHEPINAVSFLTDKCFAYISDDGTQWDALLDCSGAPVEFPEVFGIPRGNWHNDDKWSRYLNFWMSLPQRNQAWLQRTMPIPYDRIIAVDPLGDTYNPGLQLLVERRQDGKFFEPLSALRIRQAGSDRELRPTQENRMAFFPKEIPELPPSKKTGGDI